MGLLGFCFVFVLGFWLVGVFRVLCLGFLFWLFVMLVFGWLFGFGWFALICVCCGFGLVLECFVVGVCVSV